MELLHVDGKVLGDVIEEEFTEGLGLRVAVGGARVVFCSAEVTGEVYSEYDRILLDDNEVPLKLPVRSGGSYPSSYGIGVGRGLERNVVTIVIESAVAVQALRVTPSCELRVSIASSIGSEALLFVGSTSGGGSESSLVLSTPSSVTSPLIVLQTTESRVDVIELLRVELFTEETNLPFSTFPIRDDGMALAFTQSAHDSSAEVFRRGGLLEGEATVWTVAMRPPVRQRGKRIFLASVEEAYRQEVSLYQAIAAECDRIFPVLSRIERNAQMHEEVTREAILSLTPVSVGLTARMSVRRHGVNDLLIEEEVSPSVVDLVAGIVYQFTEAMEVDGETCLEVRLAVGEVRSYGIGGVALGLFRAGEEVTPRDLFSLPEIFMGASPLKDVVTDLAGVEGTLPVLTGRTPNEGNVISHVAFVDREGRELTCEESLFLPAASAEVSVICSSAGLELEILVDGVAVMSMTTSTGVSIVSIELPYASGVHALASSFGSNVLFRISDPVVVHAPMHPAFYTSGQLDGDTRTSSQRTIIAQNPNLDLDLDVVLSVRTEATLISAPTVLVERKDFCCSHALFARYSHVDLKAATNADFVGARMVYCPDTPWLACLNMTMGYALVHAEVLLDNFSMYYLPPPGGNVVIVQGTHSLALEGGELVLSRVGQGSYRTSGLSTMESWMHLCFTGGSFYIDGSRLETEYDASYEPPYLPSGSVGSTVFGCIPQLELTGFPKSLPSLMRGRARELRVVLTHPTRINSFTMFSSSGDITWTNDDEASLPQQSFTTAVVDLPDITGLSLSSHVPATLLSSPSGAVRNVCTYSTTIPLTTIAYSAEQRDSVVDFAPKTVLFTCTNDEQTTIRSEQYVQGVLPRSPAIREFTNSSFYVTPPSLVLLSTNQTTPYSLAQSILLLFNRRIELFEKDSSTLFTISSADNSEQFLIRAHSVSLLSSQISIPNSALSLSPDTQYKIHLAAGRLFNFDGHVPCVEATIEFSTI